MRRRILAVSLVVFLVGGFFVARHLHKLAFIGSGYAAQQMCSCLFVSGRSLSSCRGDLDPLAQRIVRVRQTETGVEARTLLMSATAQFDPAFGCMLQN